MFFIFSCQILTLEAIHCERLYSVTIDQSASDYDARDADLIENVFGKPCPVFPCQDDINFALLIGDKNQRTPGRNTQLGAERVIVSVRAITEIAIRVRELSPQAYRLTGHNLSAKELNIPLLRQPLRFCRSQSIGTKAQSASPRLRGAKAHNATLK